MSDIVTYCVSGQNIRNGAIVTNVNMLGGHQTVGPTGVLSQTATQTYTALENKYTNRFDDPRYYTGDAAT